MALRLVRLKRNRPRITAQRPHDYVLQPVRNGEAYLVMRVLCRHEGRITLWEEIDGIPCTQEEAESLIQAFKERQPAHGRAKYRTAP